MDHLPDHVTNQIQNYEVTVEPGYLTLIVSTTDGDLRTYTFTTEDGGLSLESHTENGVQADTDTIPDVIVDLLDADPLLNASSIDTV